MNAISLPTPEQIGQRIKDCRLEIAELKKLLRASLAVRRAEEARQRRLAPQHQCQAPQGATARG